MSNGKHQTLVVGFDALDKTYLDRFADTLPNFEHVCSNGVRTGLESTHPPWTGSAWPSMYTGTDPSHHGVYDFFVHDGYPGDARIVSRNDVRQPALWNYLSKIGRPSIVLNVPVTHPAEELEGVLIPGYLADKDARGTPESIRSDLSSELGESYRIYSRAETATDKAEKLAGYLDLIDLRRRAAVELLRSHEWELAIVQVQKTDAVFHNFDDETAFRQVYEKADELLGALLETVDETTNVVICSDHGIGPKRGYAIYVNEILRQHGYVEATNDGDTSSFAAEKRQLTGDTTSDDISEEKSLGRAFSVVGTTLQSIGIAPADVYTAARHVGLESILNAVVPDELKDAAAEIVDWQDSRAFCRTGTELGVRINLDGREPDGVVSPAEYDTVRNDLIELLRTVETPDGKAAFERVVPRERIYNGPHLERACDILLVPRWKNTIGTELYGRNFVPIDLYDHEREGVFLATGPDIDRNGALSGLSLVDVAPMVMALLGHPVPERMTGSAPGELIDGQVKTEAYGDVAFGTDDTGVGDQTAVTDRLEDLGYL